MIEFDGWGILLDIEGTTSSVRFVLDVMFPYARRGLDSYLDTEWNGEEMQRVRELMASDAGHASWVDWCRAEGLAAVLDERPAEGDPPAGRDLLRREAVRLMEQDAKLTGLKALQGLIWRSGFEDGELRAHVYDDVPPALRTWRADGRDLRIYSSGSVAAQKLFFGHTIQGDLLDCFSAHYDTTIGPKKDAESYRKIVKDIGMEAGQILFLSDIPAELDAAREAGLRTGLAKRPENDPVENTGHPEFTSFSEIHILTGHS